MLTGIIISIIPWERLLDSWKGGDDEGQIIKPWTITF